MFNQKNGIDYIIKEDADIIVFQETKCDKDKIPDEIKLPGYHHYFLDSKLYLKKSCAAYANHIINKCALIGKKPSYCGVALFSKEKPISVKYGLGNSTFDSEGRIITVEFPEFFLINVCKLYLNRYKINFDCIS